MRTLAVGLCLLALLTGTGASAADGFSCGGADVEFNVARKLADDRESRIEVIITIIRGLRTTTLRFEGDIDVVDGACVPDGTGRPTIVFQAYCTGAGCHHLDNWGIIDPQNLLVRLVPNDWNRRDAQLMLGHPLPELRHLIDIEDVVKPLPFQQ